MVRERRYLTGDELIRESEALREQFAAAAARLDRFVRALQAEVESSDEEPDVDGG